MTIEDEKVVLPPAEISLKASYRSIPALKKPLTDEEMTELAADEAVRDAIRDLSPSS